MKKAISLLLIIATLLTTSCGKKPKEDKIIVGGVKTSEYKANDILEVINKVNTYFQRKLTAQNHTWDDAVYHSGNIRAYMYTGNESFYKYSYNYAKRHNFLVNKGSNTINGDDYCISQLYLDLYKLREVDYKIEDVKRNADYNAENRTAFAWVDLIYMGLSVFSSLSETTGDNKYIDDAYRAYEKTREVLFDKNDGLWYRDERFVFGNGKKSSVTPSGKKVFWSRGNGWAFAGLAKTLETLDRDHESFNTYLDDFIQMAKSLKERQRDDGTWNANLDDPEHFGGIETSGTVMFMYGYAVGIKNGFIKYDEYFQTLKKAYDGVVKNAISEEGRLLYVQPVADSPQMYADYDNEEKRKQSTKQYAVGIFVMASCELMSMCEDYVEPTLVVPEDTYTPKPKEQLDTTYYKGNIKVTATREQTGNEAIKLVDKNIEDKDGAKWSADEFNNSAILEFKEKLDLNKIVIVPYQRRAYQYKIEASTDGKNYDIVIDYTNNNEESKFFTHNVNVEAQYIKITVTGAANYTGAWISINEILIYTKK